MLSNLDQTLLLQLLPGVGPATYWKLRDQFPSIDMALSGPTKHLSTLLPSGAIALIEDYKRLGERSQIMIKVRDTLKRARELEVTLLHVDHENYPERLREINQAPPLLYVKGDPVTLSLPQLAIVGSRSPTLPGEKNATAFARELAGNGLVITSGLALGIDAAAHRGATEAKARTIAVLGTGIDLVYPRRHQALANEIIALGGALVSEFPFGTEPIPHNFPRRNRIISGLSYGTLVVEGKVNSGSLITARYALEQNREVFALPGSVHSVQSRGCHKLIKEGAVLAESARDIFEHLQGFLARDWQQLKIQGESEVLAAGNALTSDLELRVLRQLGYEPTSVDQLAEQTHIPVGEIMACLLTMEIKGYVGHSASGYIKLESAANAVG